MTDDRLALLLISLAEPFDCVKRTSLYSLCEEPKDLFDYLTEYKNDLIENYTLEVYNRLLEASDKNRLYDFIEKNERNDVKIITILDDEYPSSLKEINDPPLVLYVKGDVSLLNTHTIGVVGPRKPDEYGISVVRKFVKGFAGSGVTVVSGIAAGVDAVAHSTALDNNGKTIAVMPCGHGVIYPIENASLYRKVAERGLLISEYPMDFKVRQFTFLERNRLISGLSDALFVPECETKSGTMITVNYAIEEGKPLFVTPGGVFDKMSKGTNELLVKGLAACVTDETMVLKELGIDNAAKDSYMQLTIQEQSVLDILEDGTIHFETLLERSKLTQKELLAILAKLEAYGLIRRSTGNYFSRY